MATGYTEYQLKYHDGNSLYAYDIPKKTQQDLLEEKEYQDFKDNVAFNQRGLPNHLLTGHGKDLESYEKRDLATTNILCFEQKMKVKQITDPGEFRKENDKLLSLKHPAKEEKTLEECTNKKEDIKPRGYNEFTKRFDLNYNKIGLRN